MADVLSEIQNSSKKVSDFITEISASSDEQSRGIEQINEAVSQMNHVTQQNAANSEESASSAEELSSQASEMRSMVSAFALSHSVTPNRPVQQRNRIAVQPRQQDKQITADMVIPMDEDELMAF